jgi:replicative DNA helicase
MPMGGAAMIDPIYKTGAALFDAWENDLWHGDAPEQWPLGPGALATDLDFGPGQVLLIGGAPGAGKTALATAMIFDALRAVPKLRALIVNVEMSIDALLNRQLARLSGVDLGIIQRREVRDQWQPSQNRIREAMVILRGLRDRVAFLEPPFTLDHADMARDDFGARAMLLDYIQRIGAPGEHGSPREGIEAAMSCIRKMALEGAGVLVLSAVARQRGSTGSDYKALGGASFRGSSELEFAADSAYILSDEDSSGASMLRCFKRRNGEPKDLALRFERAEQRFIPEGMAAPARCHTVDLGGDMQAIVDELDRDYETF